MSAPNSVMGNNLGPESNQEKASVTRALATHCYLKVVAPESRVLQYRYCITRQCAGWAKVGLQLLVLKIIQE